MLAATWICPACEALAHHQGVLEPEKPAQKELPMADPISIMRGELCWARIELVGHVKCMSWLVDECTGHSMGTGLCRRVRAHVKEKCLAKDEQACEYAKLLGMDIEHLDDDKVMEGLEKDTAGGGAGDNTIKSTTLPQPVAAAPGPAPEEAASAPAAKEEAAAEKKQEAAKAPAPASAKAPAAASAPAQYKDPDAKNGLQSQGFSGKKVKHADGETATGDWGDEYGNKKSEPRKSGAQPWRVNPWMCMAIAAMSVFCAA